MYYSATYQQINSDTYISPPQDLFLDNSPPLFNFFNPDNPYSTLSPSSASSILTTHIQYCLPLQLLQSCRPIFNIAPRLHLYQSCPPKFNIVVPPSFSLILSTHIHSSPTSFILFNLVHPYPLLSSILHSL